jgi:protein-tyrosine phosphatase
VINAGTDKCPTINYGEGIRTVTIDGLLDDPDPLKKVDAMADGPEKDAARTNLPVFPPEECAGDAKKDFARVNELIDGAIAEGGACLVHCHASLSRSVVFLLAYLMKTQGLSAVEAVHRMKPQWDATWPNDTFVAQLLEYEVELAAIA